MYNYFIYDDLYVCFCYIPLLHIPGNFRPCLCQVFDLELDALEIEMVQKDCHCGLQRLAIGCPQFWNFVLFMFAVEDLGPLKIANFPTKNRRNLTRVV